MTEVQEWVEVPDSLTGEVVLRGQWVRSESGNRTGLLLIHPDEVARRLEGCGGGVYLFWGDSAEGETPVSGDDDETQGGHLGWGGESEALASGFRPLVGTGHRLVGDDRSAQAASVGTQLDNLVGVSLTTDPWADGGSAPSPALDRFSIEGTIAHRGTGAADLSPHPECKGTIVEGRWHSL